MPGMMDTVLNVGLTPETIPGMIARTGNPRFVWDSYRRLIMMYADVVMEKAEGLEPPWGWGSARSGRKARRCEAQQGIPLRHGPHRRGPGRPGRDLQQLVERHLGKPFPDNPIDQLWGAIAAVFKSWNGKKAVSYRRIEGIPDEWGTAVNVQAMVFGNMGDSSGTGVAFTRDPATGANAFFGEWLVNAQGEDVVAGIRTPSPINDETRNEQNKHLVSMAHARPEVYRELCAIRANLEHHFRDMLAIEFTIQEGKLWMLQCRVGKRTGTAALNMAIDMLDEGIIDEKRPSSAWNPGSSTSAPPDHRPQGRTGGGPILKGLPAGPGAACGVLVFTAEEAVAKAWEETPCILLRKRPTPRTSRGCGPQWASSPPGGA
jgi:pyruvate,orthophosphate dikinase